MGAIARNVDNISQEDGLFRIDVAELNLVNHKELRSVLLENGVVVEGDLKRLFDKIEPIYELASPSNKRLLLNEIVRLFSREAQPRAVAGGELSQHVDQPSERIILDDVGPEQLQTWREVEAIRARAYRAQLSLSPERADEQRVNAAERARAYRARMSLEKAEEYKAKARDRMRAKREPS